jgi:outer membrane protein assembly factor BamB
VRVLSAASLASLVTVSAVDVLAQTATAWSQFQGGAAKTGSATEAPGPGYGRAWFTAVEPAGPGDRFGLSAPVVADGVVIAVGPERVIGIDAASGRERITVDRDLGPSVPAAVTPDGSTVVYTQGWGDGPPNAGQTASPSPSPATASDQDTATLPSVAAFDLATGKAPWPPVALDGVSRTGVTIDGGSAYVGTNEGVVTAVGLADGEVAWRRQLAGTVITPLAVADDLVLVGLQGDRASQPAVVALAADTGEERWRHEPEALSATVSALSVEGGSAFAIFAGPTVIDAVALDVADGGERWHRSLNVGLELGAPPVTGDGAVYLTDLIGHVRALDAETGEERWDFAVNTSTFQGVPLLAGDHLLVPTVEGELAAIDVGTGMLVWRRPADDAPLRAMAPAGDLLVAVRGGARSGLEAFEHDPSVALVTQASPTTLAIGRMLGTMAIAVAPLLALVLFLGWVLARRMGPAFPEGDDITGPGEPDAEGPISDPWEDEGSTP